MLQMLSIDVANTCCWVLQMLNFNVADVEFRCCRLMMLGLCRGEGGRAPNVGCCMQHGSQHDHNIVATWGEGEERLLMLDVAHNRVHNIFATRSQLLDDRQYFGIF
jgi:hypothetical protein